MDLLTILIIAHVSIMLCLLWSNLPPLWRCYTEGRMRHFVGAALMVVFIAVIPVYNAYCYLTDDLSYFYHAPYEDDDEEDTD